MLIRQERRVHRRNREPSSFPQSLILPQQKEVQTRLTFMDQIVCESLSGPKWCYFICEERHRSTAKPWFEEEKKRWLRPSISSTIAIYPSFYWTLFVFFTIRSAKTRQFIILRPGSFMVLKTATKTKWPKSLKDFPWEWSIVSKADRQPATFNGGVKNLSEVDRAFLPFSAHHKLNRKNSISPYNPLVRKRKHRTIRNCLSELNKIYDTYQVIWFLMTAKFFCWPAMHT